MPPASLKINGGGMLKAIPLVLAGLIALGIAAVFLGPAIIIAIILSNK